MAASTLVGNSLGAENIPLAKKYAAIIMRGAVAVNVTVALVLYVMRHVVTSIYIAETD
jgi:Na+-driven multidrug efflux pump